MSRVVYLLPVLGALFLLGFVVNITKGEATMADSIIQFAVAGLSFAGFAFFQNKDRAQRDFATYVTANVDSIRSGTANYKGQPLSYATRLRVYHTALSFLIVSFKLPSGIVVVGGPSARRTHAACSLVSLLLGWWGLPWGPIFTVQVLINNLRGHREFTMAELIEGKTEIALPWVRVTKQAS